MHTTPEAPAPFTRWLLNAFWCQTFLWMTHTSSPKLPGPSRHALRLDAGRFLGEGSPSLTQDVHRNPSLSALLYRTGSLKSAGVSASIV